MSLLTIRDGTYLTGVGSISIALGNFMGRYFHLLPSTNIKTLAINILSMAFSGVAGRELSLSTVEKNTNSKKPGVRYLSLTLGIAGMAAALTRKVSLGRFEWEGSSLKEVGTYASLIASSMCVYDHLILFPKNRRQVQQNLESSAQKLKEELDLHIKGKAYITDLVTEGIDFILVDKFPYIRSNRFSVSYIDLEKALCNSETIINKAKRYGITVPTSLELEKTIEQTYKFLRNTGKISIYEEHAGKYSLPIPESFDERVEVAKNFFRIWKNRRKYDGGCFSQKSTEELKEIQEKLISGEIYFYGEQEIEWTLNWIKLHFCKNPPIPGFWEDIGFYPNPIVKNLIPFENQISKFSSFFGGLTCEILDPERTQPLSASDKECIQWASKHWSDQERKTEMINSLRPYCPEEQDNFSRHLEQIWTQ